VKTEISDIKNEPLTSSSGRTIIKSEKLRQREVEDK
jgi:hypothetical protein